MFSDVVMPNGMNGVELAREARRLSKDIKILLTSGYAEDVMERHRAVGEFPIIDKPFRLGDLARRLRSILQEPARRSSSPPRPTPNHLSIAPTDVRDHAEAGPLMGANRTSWFADLPSVSYRVVGFNLRAGHRV